MYLVDTYNNVFPTTHRTILFPRAVAAALRREVRDRAARIEDQEATLTLQRFTQAVTTRSGAVQPTIVVRDDQIAAVGVVVEKWVGETLDAPHCAVTMLTTDILTVQQHCKIRARTLGDRYSWPDTIARERVRLLRSVAEAKESDLLARRPLYRATRQSPARGMEL